MKKSKWYINHLGDVCCDECGRLAPYAKVIRIIDERKMACIQQLTNAPYCHNCGAKMEPVDSDLADK